ncbi:MAG: PIG-L family deacetylase, partial [Chloroflexi bacterium]|nr:PIG-L family deacetylase [Chloroflexota bacterium]
QADPDRVIGQLVEVVRQVRPDLIITHDPSGGYGHPDHQTICRHMTSAFPLAGDATAFPEQLSSGQKTWAPKLLYYVCFPQSNFRRMWREMLDLGITPPFASVDIDSLGTPDEEVTTTLDVSAYVDTKIESLACHQTQIDPNGPFAQLPEESMRKFMSTEYYLLAIPEGSSPEADLLGGL